MTWLYSNKQVVSFHRRLPIIYHLIIVCRVFLCMLQFISLTYMVTPEIPVDDDGRSLSILTHRPQSHLIYHITHCYVVCSRPRRARLRRHTANRYKCRRLTSMTKSNIWLSDTQPKVDKTIVLMPPLARGLFGSTWLGANICPSSDHGWATTPWICWRWTQQSLSIFDRKKQHHFI